MPSFSWCYHCILIVSKSPHLFWTLLHTLADRYNATIWRVPICPPAARFSSPTFSLLKTVPSVPVTISIASLSFFIAFLFSSKVHVLISLFAFFYFHYVVNWGGKVHYTANSQFLFTMAWACVLACVMWYVSISKSQKMLSNSLGRCYYFFLSFKIFSHQCWSLTNNNPLKSPGFFSVFWRILIFLKSRRFSLVLLFPSTPIPISFFGDCTKSTNNN